MIDFAIINYAFWQQKFHTVTVVSLDTVFDTLYETSDLLFLQERRFRLIQPSRLNRRPR
jgi:hypothetical protein